MELSDYNGWENKFTWLVHLHLSNEQSLMNEMASLVARTYNDALAGRLVEQWVQTALTGWVTDFPTGDRCCDASFRLLVWDMAGTALAYTDWERLVLLLVGQAMTSENPLTWVLFTSIANDAHIQQEVQYMSETVTNSFAYADMLQEWFRTQLDMWMEMPASRRRHVPSMVMLVQHLLQQTYGVVCWEHVARAFRIRSESYG